MEKVKTKSQGRPKIQLSCAEICAIIESGSKHGAAQVRYGKFAVVYQGGKPSALNPSLPTPKDIKQAEEETLAVAEMDVKDDELAIKAITNPEEYEDLLANGELVEKEG